MPRRKSGLTCLSKILFSVILFPTPLLALILNIPYVNPAIATFYFTWVTEDGDFNPDFISIELTGCLESLFAIGLYDPTLHKSQGAVSPSKFSEARDGILPCHLLAYASLQQRLPSNNQSRRASRTLLGVTQEFRIAELVAPPPSASQSSTSTNINTNTNTRTSTRTSTGPRPGETAIKNDSLGSGISANHTSTTSSSDSGSSLSVPTQPPNGTRASSSNSGSSLSAPTPSQSPSTTPSTTQTPSGPMSRSNHRGALIGGVLGGFAFLALTVGLGCLYRRHRRARRASMLASHPHDDHRRLIGARGSALLFSISSPFNRNMEKSTIGGTTPRSGGNHPPESKSERLERIRREVEEAQMLREVFQLDLQRHSNMNTPDDGMEGGPERADTAALRVQIEQMTTMISELQAEVQRQVEENSPPDYSVVVVSSQVSLVVIGDVNEVTRYCGLLVLVFQCSTCN